MSGTTARRLGAVLAATLGLALPATGQEGSAAGPLADVPSGPALLRGRVVHAEGSQAVPGVDVVLYALGPNGRPGSRRTESDATGAFAFQGISNDPGVVYLVGARHAGLPFPGDRVVFAAGETERSIEIRVSEPTDDPSAVHLVQSSVRVSIGQGGLDVAEVHRLRNDGNRVFHVSPELRSSRRAPLHAELLPGAQGFAMPLGVVPEGVARAGRDFRFWGPIYPGEQDISFQYSVPLAVGSHTLTKRFPTPAGRIRVFGPEGGPLEAVAGMEAGEPVEEMGLRFESFEAPDPGPDFLARLSVRVPETRAEPGSLELLESQMVLEVDDATLQAQEQHQLEVEGDAILQAAPGELLLNLPLPEGAEDIRFSTDANGLGLVRTEQGVGIVGPVSPGRHGFGLAFTLRSGPEGVRFERRFDRRLPLLRVFVADTGVAVETDRLHRRRPVRDADRTYLLFEAFEVEPDEPLHFSLRALPPRSRSTRPALAAALALGLGSVAFLLAPLARSDEEILPSQEDTAPETRIEREQLYESIHDLDHDYETGKLDEEGWQSLRAELRGRAVALLAREREQESAVGEAQSAEPEGPAGCPSCGAEARPGDRFCARCGSALAARTA